MQARVTADRLAGWPPSRDLSALGLSVLCFEAEGEERVQRRPTREASRQRREATDGSHRHPRVRAQSDGIPTCRGGRGMSLLVGSLVRILLGVQSAVRISAGEKETANIGGFAGRVVTVAAPGRPPQRVRPPRTWSGW